MSPGRRESEWLVIRRCLAIIQRAQRGPAGRDELIEAVLAQEGPEAYGETKGDALRRRLENDLQRIRENLMVDLRFDHQAGGYAIRDTWLPLLDLPDDELASFDVVVASVHLGLRQEREKMTARVVAAMRNPHVDIIAHPTGRLWG